MKAKSFIIPLLALFSFPMIFENGSLSVVNASLTSDFKTEYMVGEEISIPDCTIGGKLAKCVVTLPDNSVTNSKNFKLKMAGIYNINYKNEFGEESKSFTVYQKKYGLSSTAGTCEYREQVFKTGEGTTDSKYGIYAELSDGTSFTYNKPIDISKYKKDDTIISLNVIARNDGVCDFKDLVIRLTDAVDSKNYVEYIIDHNGNKDDVGLDSVKYIRAGAANQIPSGIEHSTGQLHVGSYGTWCRCTFMNMAIGGNNMTETVNIHMDYQNRICYGPEKDYNNYICDLDNPNHFGESLWDGFTNGECFVSVYAMNFFNTSGAIFINNVGEDSESDFEKNILQVEKGPDISVDFAGYSSSNLPKAVVNKPYKIFKASAIDNFAICNGVSTKVILNENFEKPVNIAIKDGTFTPTLPGMYSIKYIAKNAFNKESVVTVYVEAILDDNPLSIELIDKVESANTGIQIPLASYNYQNNQGNVDAKITVTGNGAVEDIKLENRYFTPKNSGTYVVNYLITDYAGQSAAASYSIVVTDSDLPIIDQNVNMNKYLVANYDNRLPIVKAIDYKDGKKEIPTTIYVSENGKEPVKLNSNLYEPSASSEDYSVTITYKATGKYGNSELSFSAVVHDISAPTGKRRINTSKLFVQDSGVSSTYELYRGNNYATYSSNSSSKIEYVNPIPLNSFALELNILSNSFGKLNIRLADYYSRASKVISIEKGADGIASISVDGGIKIPLTGVTFGDINQQFDLTYNKEIMMLGTENAFSFNSSIFTSHLVALSIEFEDVTGVGKAMVRKVCNQLLNEYDRDTAEPLIAVNGSYAYLLSIGETVDVHSAVCVDMVNPSISAVLTVKSPSGNIVEGIENADISKEYSFVATEYGNYKISYKIDTVETTYDFLLTVMDNQGPNIKLKNKLESTYSFGTTVTLSAVSIDDVDGEVETMICVEDTYGCSEWVKNGSEYRFTQRGTYVIKFSSFDSSYNMSLLAITILVK